jgi:hypothetical protein
MSDTDTDTRKSTLLTKILKHPAAGAEMPGDPRPPFEDARVRSRDTLAIDIRFADGRRAGFNYSYLMETDFEIRDSGEVITLRFTNALVIIEGRCLTELYDKLLDNRARLIQEGTEGEEELLDANAPYIERIEIERKEKRP